MSPDDPEFVESGLERVADGVHALSPLTKGKAYKVSVACVGTGSVAFLTGREGRKAETVACDGVPEVRRVENAPERLPLDVTGKPGATGMVAWQITSLPS